jgi:hypothetical protein
VAAAACQGRASHLANHLRSCTLLLLPQLLLLLLPPPPPAGAPPCHHYDACTALPTQALDTRGCSRLLRVLEASPPPAPPLQQPWPSVPLHRRGRVPPVALILRALDCPHLISTRIVRIDNTELPRSVSQSAPAAATAASIRSYKQS